MEVTFHPMSSWPHQNTPEGERRGRFTFKAGWDNTLRLLDSELSKLDASNVRLGCGLRPQDIRKDGWPRSGAMVPDHPGVELSFDSPHGRLVYASDACVTYEDNVRSIALGLEALRAVDRFGISMRGQQYAGFKALPPGADEGPNAANGMDLIKKYGSVSKALKATHPDLGGDPKEFRDVNAAKEQFGG